MSSIESEAPIGKRTPITIGLVIALLGGVGWLTDMNNKGTANARSIDEVKIEQMETRKSLRHVEKWLSAIGQKLGVREPAD